MKLFRPDPILPGIECLLDVRKFANLASIRGPITIENIRYKPQTSCLVSYCIGVENRTSPHGWIHAKAFRSDDWASRKTKLSKNHPDRSKVQLIDELAIAVFSFPKDSELPAIERLMTDPSEFVKRVTNEPLGNVRKISVLAYKPNRRLTAKIDTESERPIVLKLYESRHFDLIDRKLRPSSPGQIPITTRLNHSHRHSVICFDWIEGRPPDLATLDDRQMKWLVNGLSKCVDSFQDFQIKQSRLTESNPRVSIDNIAQYLSIVLPPVTDILIETGARIILLLDKIQQTQSSGRGQLVHGDFHPDQILVQGDRVTVCDFDKCHLGDPVSDWGNFLAHVEYQSICGDCPFESCRLITDQIANLQRFQRESQSNKLQLFQLVSLFQLLTHPFRSGLENWSELTESLVTTLDEQSRKLAADLRMSDGTTEYDRKSKTDSIKQSILNDESFSFLHDCLSVPTANQTISSADFVPQGSLGDAAVIDVVARRHKPGRRCLIEFRLETQNGIRLAILGKASAKKLKRRTVLNQQALYDEYGFGSDSQDLISIPRTRGLVKKWNMWFQEKIIASTCGELCETDNTSGVPVRIGAAIWKLHHCQYDPRRQHQISDELAMLTDRLEKYQMQMPENQCRIEKIKQQCGQLCDNLQPAGPVLLHRDFYHEQMLFSEDRTWLIDLDLVALGHPAIDVGNFLAHLTELGIRRHNNAEHYRQLEDRIAKEYRRLNPNCSSHSIQICKTLTLARHIFISHQIDDRRPITESIIKLVEHRLKECASRDLDSVP